MAVSSQANKQERGPISIYQLNIAGSNGTVVGTTELNSVNDHFQGELWIQGDKVLGIDYRRGYGNVLSWPYPEGGKRRGIIKIRNQRFAELWGITVSVPPPRLVIKPSSL